MTRFGVTMVGLVGWLAGCSLVVDGSEYVGVGPGPGNDGGGHQDGGGGDAGGGDGATGGDGSVSSNPLEDLAVLQNDYHRARCECGITSELGCPDHNPPELVSCLGGLYDDTDPVLAAAVACEVPLWAQAVDCATASLCDETALTTCANNLRNGLWDCPSIGEDTNSDVLSCIAGASTLCEDATLFTTLPTVVMGSTSRRGARFLNCANGVQGGPDFVYMFIAPYTGTFVFETFDNAFDTVLSVRSNCDPSNPPLGCNDDCPTDFCPTATDASYLVLDLEVAQLVYVGVKGYFPSQHGRFVLAVWDYFVGPVSGL